MSRPPHRSGPAPRLAAIRDNLTARIAEAEREGWLGEAEGLRGQPRRPGEALPARRADPPAAVGSLGIPAYRDIAARAATLPGLSASCR